METLPSQATLNRRPFMSRGNLGRAGLAIQRRARTGIGAEPGSSDFTGG